MNRLHATPWCRVILACSPLVLFTACAANAPAEHAPVALRIKLSREQTRTAIHTWSDAGLRIDRELIQAEANQDAKAIRMIRYRRAFAAEVLARLESGRYHLIVVDSEHPPTPSSDLLSTYGFVFRHETGNWAALIQVSRSENPELFKLFEASKNDFLPPK